MGRLIVSAQVTVDGVMDQLEGWFDADDESSQHGLEQLRAADALVLGRETYEFLSEFWPAAEGQYAELINPMPKYVASRTLQEPLTWNSRLLDADAAEAVAALKAGVPGQLVSYGCGELANHRALARVRPRCGRGPGVDCDRERPRSARSRWGHGRCVHLEQGRREAKRGRAQASTRSARRRHGAGDAAVSAIAGLRTLRSSLSDEDMTASAVHNVWSESVMAPLRRVRDLAIVERSEVLGHLTFCQFNSSPGEYWPWVIHEAADDLERALDALLKGVDTPATRFLLVPRSRPDDGPGKDRRRPAS